MFLTLVGFALRLYYLTTTHPFFDEYTTVLAAWQIWQHGLPILPSGLFYEHGLLATYLIAPFTALFLDTSPDQWQAGQWGLLLARWPSLLVSTATIPFIYVVARRCFKQTAHHALAPELLVAALFAFSPEGIIWGARARMYALATWFVLLTVYFAYRSLRQPRYRWVALLALGLTLLTHFGALMIIPPLLIAMVVVGRKNFHGLPYREVLGQGLILALLIIMAVFIKRLGQPLGKTALDSSSGNTMPSELLSTITYQTTFHFNWAEMVQFLGRQFGVPHLYGLTLATLGGLMVSFIIGLRHKNRVPQPDSFTLFVGLIWGLIILESVTMLESFRQNPRYLVMVLPLFYLLAAQSISYPLSFIHRSVAPFLSGIIYFLLLIPNLSDIHLALITPEPGYEEAFAFVRAHWQPNDAVLTMNTPAAALYLGRVDGFAVEVEADQFLLNRTTTPIDRWLGAPWIGTAVDFNAVLNRHQRVWFVSDTIRQPVYYRGSWQAIINSQMEQVWAKDNALVYRTRPQRAPLPTHPDTIINANLNNLINLVGYTLQTSDHRQLKLTLFWQSRATAWVDYTIFVHLRHRDGTTVAQWDGLPLDGAYPTTRWQSGETIIDPISLPIPANLPTGDYTLWVGMYQLATLERLPIINDTSGENGIILQQLQFLR